MSRFHSRRFARYFLQISAGFGVISLGGCATTIHTPPVVEIRTQTVVKEVAKPCPVTKPARPAPLPKTMPTDLSRFAATLAAKLVEWAGPGGYGDRADAAITECKKAGAE